MVRLVLLGADDGAVSDMKSKKNKNTDDIRKTPWRSLSTPM